ncbi:MAG: hypothetical protein M3R02_26045 [Chloroflexota bacterium]|nr:hypothetical protein [Chloroflexota bacterium]
MGRVGEGGADGVANGLEHTAAVVLDGLPQERVVARDRRPHRLGMVLPPLGRAFHVREQEGDGIWREGRRVEHW